MGDNIDDIEPDIVLLSDLPQQYQNHIVELKNVIRTFFTVGDGDGGGGVDSDVLTFLEMCHQVFDLDFNKKGCTTGSKLIQDLINDDCESSFTMSPVVASTASEILNNLMTKYRSYFRKRYRGYTYLTSGVLQETFELAYTDTKQAYSDKRKSKSTPTASEKVGIMSLLRKGMLQEFQWLEKINEHKRQMLLDSIKSEVIEEFESNMKTQFPSAFSGDEEDDFSTRFYEDDDLVAKVNLMVKSSVEDFKKQVPYEEEPNELNKLGVTLEAELTEKIVHDLIEKNTRNKENAESFMERLVDHSTKMYRDKLFKLIGESPIVEPDQVLHYHLGLQTEFMKKFEHEESRFPSQKLHGQFLNMLNESIHNSLKDILANCSESGTIMLKECKKRSKVELDKCMRKIARIFGEYGLSQYFDDFCETVEANLKESLEEIRHCTIINAEKMEEALETAKCPVLDEDTKPTESSETKCSKIQKI